MVDGCGKGTGVELSALEDAIVTISMMRLLEGVPGWRDGELCTDYDAGKAPSDQVYCRVCRRCGRSESQKT